MVTFREFVNANRLVEEFPGFYRIPIGDVSITMRHFKWDKSTVLFSHNHQPPPLQSLFGREVVMISGPSYISGRPNFIYFIDANCPDWTFPLPVQINPRFLQTLGALDKRPKEEKHFEVYPQYERE